MKKSNELILLVALLAAAFVAPRMHAQENPDRPEGVEGAPPPQGRFEQVRENMMKMADALGLSVEQRAQVKEIMTANGGEMKAIMQDTSLEMPAKREKMMELRKGVEAKIDAILTPEQLAKKNEFRATHGAPGPGGEKAAKKKAKPTE